MYLYGFFRTIGEWVYHFQTLLTGLLAVSAAVLTIYFIRQQIRLNELNRKDDIRRRLWLAKSVASFAISSLHNHTKDVVRLLEKDLDEFSRRDETERNMSSFEISDFPVFPHEDFISITNLIPLTSNQNAEILAKYSTIQQVYSSRLRGFKSDCLDGNHLVSKASFYARIFEQIVIANFLDRFFAFVRNLENDKIDAFEEHPHLGPVFSLRLFTDPELSSHIANEEWPPLIP